MRIVINALSVTSGGGLTAMLNLLPALDLADPGNEYCVIVSQSQESLIRAIPKRFEIHIASINANLLAMRLAYEQLLLPFMLRKLKADWLYSVGGQTSLAASVKIFLLIENANPFSRLDINWTWKDRLRHAALKVLARLSANRATLVRFLSENSRKLIVGMLSIPDSKTVVIPHGATLVRDKQGTHRRSLVLPDRYILFVSNIGPHKNVHTLVEAFKKLVEVHGYPGMLLLAGQVLEPDYGAKLRRRIRGTVVDGRIEFMGWVYPEDMKRLFEQSDLFVFPSIEETFGMPVLEAMGLGVPVVVPEAPDERYFIPYKELCGDAAMYFKPEDSMDLSAAMNRVLQDRVLRSQLITAGLQRVQQFQWEDTAGRIAEVFRHS